MELVYLILGSNLGSRDEYLHQGLSALSYIGKVLRQSAIYESEPWGFEHPDQFLNQAVELETSLSADDLLTALQSIEQNMGRVRTSGSYQARTLDIDILFYGSLVLNTPKLIIPHPHMAERMFVLTPLNDLIPDFIHPVLHRTIKELKTQCPDTLKVNIWK